MGLEPLSKHELQELVSRLSEPKKASVDQEEAPSVQVTRPKTTGSGTGRFVGMKKMNNFQIEKMVERLYSRRQTKNFEFVDDEVNAEDILNMTNRDDTSTDSEDEVFEASLEHVEVDKRTTNRKSAFKRRQSSGLSREGNIIENVLISQKPVLQSLHSSQKFSNEQNDEVQTKVFSKVRRDNVKAEIHPRFLQRESTVSEDKRADASRTNAIKRHESERSSCARPLLQRRSTMYDSSLRTSSFQRPLYERLSDTRKVEFQSLVGKFRPNSEPTYLKRTPSFSVSTTTAEYKGGESTQQPFRRINCSKIDVQKSRSLCAWKDRENDVDLENVPSISESLRKPTSPMSVDSDSGSGKCQRLPRLECKTKRSPRFLPPSDDELLIDRVATHNRYQRLRTT